MARALVRGADPDWVRRVHDFALKPDIVVYLRVSIDELITRVVQSEGFNYWESGMDMHLGEDLYESFVEYQKRLLREFENMAEQYNFQTIETSHNIEDVFEQIKARIVPLLQTPR
jgi:dTMP kinase